MARADQAQIDWQEKVLPQATRKALKFFAGQAWLKRSDWYLAGGTALALQVGHRKSVDLDFFTPQKGFRMPTLLKRLQNPHWQTTNVEADTLYGEQFSAKVSFIGYPFFVPKAEPHWYGAIRVLDPSDIAVMKIIAISQRGRKRDFLDLFWIIRHLEPLEQILRRLKTQYPAVAHDYHHILKSLTYFEDADTDPMPALNFAVRWQDVKKSFIAETVPLTKKVLELK